MDFVCDLTLTLGVRVIPQCVLCTGKYGTYLLFNKIVHTILICVKVIKSCFMVSPFYFRHALLKVGDYGYLGKKFEKLQWWKWAEIIREHVAQIEELQRTKVSM
jgi:hypothetical protein